MWDTLLEIAIMIAGYGIALVVACAIAWAIAKIFRDGPFPLQIIIAVALLGLLFVGPIVGIWQGTQDRNPTYYDEIPNPEFDRYS